MDKAHKHKLFVKVSALLRVRQAQSFLLVSGRLALRSVLRTDLRVWAGTGTWEQWSSYCVVRPEANPPKERL